jgi:hypothetical protein
MLLSCAAAETPTETTKLAATANDRTLFTRPASRTLLVLIDRGSDPSDLSPQDAVVRVSVDAYVRRDRCFVVITTAERLRRPRFGDGRTVRDGTPDAVNGRRDDYTAL